jgi:chemotaxis-related protein WspD
MPERKDEVGCWNKIGVWGDRSCPELEAAVHCHNCPVFSAAGRSLLDREAPDEYLGEWAEAITRPAETKNANGESAVVFRLASEWFGLPVHLCREVVEDCPIHTLPHRSDAVFLGLVNVRGQLQLCISLANFLASKRKRSLNL